MRIASALALVTAAALSAAVVSAQTATGLTSARIPAATKYSTLDQINTSNVKSLQKAWTFHTGDKTGFFESTPLVVDGTMYVTAQNGVFALDAQTGAQLWKFESDGGTRRGLTYWPGDGKTPARIFGSAQERLIALDAKTGRLVPQFGQGGFVDMGTTMASPASRLQGHPDHAGDLAGDSRVECAHRRAALDVRSVAQPGDPNNKTWEGDSWKAVGGTNTWGYLTIDTERGIVYVPMSIAGENDYVGVTRPGDNLYGTSLVAIDIATGKRLWHQQLVHHDIWDNDLGAHPTLIDVTRNGKTDSRRRADHEDGPAVHLQSRHRRADVRHGGASGSAEHRARREDRRRRSRSR